MRRRHIAAGLATLTLLAACGGDPTETGGNGGGGNTIVVGSQDYYSNEIIAEIYALALEDAGYTVDRQFRIGQREVYLPEIEDGKIDLLPEYTGNLLQYWVPDTDARLSEDVYEELKESTPDGLTVLDQAAATDQDSYTVTREFADEWDLETIDDLAGVETPLVLGGNNEALTRPYGPEGLKETYGIDIEFTPIEDSGGPVTVKALVDGDIQLGNIYTASPAIELNNLVPLEDTKGLFLASHVVPLASDNVDEKAQEIINEISANLSAEDLVAMNIRSTEDQESAATIARDWLTENDLIDN